MARTIQWLQAGSYPASDDRRLIGALWPGPASSGCAVTAGGTNMTVNVAIGQVAVPSQNNTGSTLCSSTAVETVTVGTAPGVGLNRIDLVVCQPRGADLDGGANNDFIFTTVAGVAAASPVAPATPAGAVALAQVYVGANVAVITNANITDLRPFGLAVGSAQALPPPVTSGALQSFTDDNGEVWVAKPGVNGGAWKKARDVLHARVYRVASLSLSGSGNNYVYEGVDRDPYGLYVATSFVMPVPGIYDVRMTMTATAGATAQWISNRVYTGAQQVAFTQTWASAAGGLTTHQGWRGFLAQGATLLPQGVASVAMTGSGGISSTFAELSYLGTG